MKAWFGGAFLVGQLVLSANAVADGCAGNPTVLVGGAGEVRKKCLKPGETFSDFANGPEM